MTVQALKHKKILKKKMTKFTKYESHDFNKLKSSWRKPHGFFFLINFQVLIAQLEEDIEVTNLWLKLDSEVIKKPDI